VSEDKFLHIRYDDRSDFLKIHISQGSVATQLS